MRLLSLRLLAALLLATPAMADTDSPLARHLGDFAADVKPGKMHGYIIAERGGWVTFVRSGPPGATFYTQADYTDQDPASLTISAMLFTGGNREGHGYIGLAYKMIDENNLGAVMIGSDGRVHHFRVDDKLPRLEWIEDSHPRLDGTDRLKLNVTRDTATAWLNERQIFTTSFSTDEPWKVGFLVAGSGVSGLTGVTVVP